MQAVGIAAARVAGLVAPDAKGADAEAYPWFCARSDGVVNFLDEQIHILTAPVTSAHSLTVFGVRGIVRKFVACHRIWVEIVVEVYSIDVIAVDDVHDHFGDELTVFGQSGVEIHLAIALVGDKSPWLAMV